MARKVKKTAPKARQSAKSRAADARLKSAIQPASSLADIVTPNLGSMLPKMPIGNAVGGGKGMQMAMQGLSKTKISSKHQVTIPKAAFKDAGLKAGDILRVEADSAGRVILTRVDELVDRYAGSLKSGGKLGETVREIRDEWR